jgi:hypothetical protein
MIGILLSIAFALIISTAHAAELQQGRFLIDGERSRFVDTVSECTTVYAENTSAYADYEFIGLGTNNNYYMGQHNYAPGENINVCAVVVKLRVIGVDVSDHTLYAHIFDQDGNNLDTELGVSGGVTGNNSWSDTEVTFSFSPAVSLSGGTNYAIVLRDADSEATHAARFTLSLTGGLAGQAGRFGPDGTRIWSSNSDGILKILVQ